MSSVIKVNTIQDAGGNAMISSDGAGTFTSSLPNTGITMADQWRINTDLNTSSASGFFTTNWEINDTSGFAKIGTGLTESSGVFSFPSTGVYLITIDFMAYGNGGARSYFGTGIYITLNNSSYSAASMCYSSSYTSGAYGAMSSKFIFNVTDISNYKFKIGYETASASTIFEFNTSRNSNNLTVIRLGDSV